LRVGATDTDSHLFTSIKASIPHISLVDGISSGMPMDVIRRRKRRLKC